MSKIVFMAVAAMLTACGSSPDAPGANPIAGSDTTRVPLNDLGTNTYRGFQGGLYPGGSNVAPPDHDASGIIRRNAIRPLDINGIPSASGKFVLISIGMSNTTQEWCSQGSGLPCDSWTLIGRAAADPTVNKGTLVIVNGAAGGQDAVTWSTPISANYDRIRDTRLSPLGLSEKQVQIAWVKLADARPTQSLPAQNADAYTLLSYLGQVVRSLKTRYPNLQQVFLTSRLYAGYATTDLNPEPYAYEGGFSAKWAIEAQITQERNGTIDQRAGNLSYSTGTSPWIAWGPYLWANGLRARSDGLTWDKSEFETDGTHPSQSGESKVGMFLLDFFKTSVYTRCWFISALTCS